MTRKITYCCKRLRNLTSLSYNAGGTGLFFNVQPCKKGLLMETPAVVEQNEYSGLQCFLNVILMVTLNCHHLWLGNMEVYVTLRVLEAPHKLW